MSYTAGKATQAYSSVGTHTSVDAANPHRLILLLMDGALDKIAVAKGQLQRQAIGEKAQSISRAMAIIDGLRMSLDTSVEHELTTNLESLYDYMNRRLLLANVNNDAHALDEVSGLMRELKEAWAAMPEPMRSGRADASVELAGQGA